MMSSLLVDANNTLEYDSLSWRPFSYLLPEDPRWPVHDSSESRYSAFVLAIRAPAAAPDCDRVVLKLSSIFDHFYNTSRPQATDDDHDSDDTWRFLTVQQPQFPDRHGGPLTTAAPVAASEAVSTFSHRYTPTNKGGLPTARSKRKSAETERTTGGG
ncbi:hypothetical protein CMUS01_00659 [Colletotrichum musicola]|uniref:Uncharacterized protein n=1 Tax=Colletotrichum musicola TaxID=2175873 RepID=A0A8H6NY87_9PEZI|nr:hypothetical protein CMUS01_00659 [Colletotrichum musicola]